MIDLPENSRCACGAELPDHFILDAADKLTHVCACERRYVVRAVNPFARYDAAQAKARQS